MASSRSAFGVFILLSILYSATSRPSSSSSTSTPNYPNQRQNQLENGQTTNSNKGGSHVGRPYGNDIMMKEERKITETDKAMEYMYKFGYMEVPNNPVSKMPKMTSEKMIQNLKKMQMMMGIPMTGKLDTLTMMMVDKPRCGVHDPADRMVVSDKAFDIQVETSSHIFMHRDEKWPRNNITYRILNFPSTLNRNDAYTSIQQAFKVWSDVTPLIFTEKVAGYADIYLKFGRYEHGDYQPFDGRGGTFAHTFMLGSNNGDLEGDVHFDDSEIFTFHSKQGSNLFNIATHEIGHALGLEHSSNPRALMSPFIKPYDPEFTLHSDDIADIQDLYGVPPTTKDHEPEDSITTATVTQLTSTVHGSTQPPTTEAPSSTQGKSASATDTAFVPRDTDTSYSSSYSSDYSASSSDYSDSSVHESCPPYHSFFDRENGIGNYNEEREYLPNSDCNVVFDAVTSYRGEVFAFKNDRYWRITKDMGLISPFGGSSTEGFFQTSPKNISFPNNIDAAYEQYSTSKLFVFKGSNFYVYDGLSLESGPQPITDLDPSLPSDVDAVLTWGEYYKTYFFKGDQVWRYDERVEEVDEGWPWLINQIWTGVPNYLTSAFRWGDYTNFLQGNRLFAYDDYCYYVNPLDNPKSFTQEFINGECPNI